MRYRASWLLAGLVLWALSAPAAGVGDDTPFPRPPELLPRVEFWKKVFTLYDTGQVVVHDRDDLSLVYGVEELGGGGHQAREAEIVARYRQAMERLAAFPAEADPRRLGDEEWRIWQAHGQRRDPARYRQASERLRLQTGQRDRIAQGLINWQQYGEEVRRILYQHGVPDSLAVLAFIESAFNPEARSKVGALGLWQITRPAATRLLRMDRHVDERRDPLKATAAAAAILRQNYQALGSWPLAITAYNHGAAGMARGVREVGSRDLPVIIDRYQGKAFGFAGKNFYAEFLAALEIIPRHTVYFGDPLPAIARDSTRVDRPLAALSVSAASPPPVPPPTAPAVAQLETGDPNPFSSTTTIAYALEQPRMVQVDIYDAAGQRVRQLVQQIQGPGAFQVGWDGTTDAGTQVASGVYFTRLQAGTWSAYRKLMLLR